MSLRHTVLHALLPRYSRGGLPAFARRAVARTLRDDVDLAAAYEALRALETAAAGGAVPAGQRELLWSGILDDVDAAERVASPSASPWALPAGLAGVCALVVVAVVARPVVAPGGDSHDVELTARGDLDQRPLGVRVRCVVADRVVGDAVAGARQHDGVLRCDDDGALAFSLTNLGDTPRYAFVVGVAANDDVVLLAPFHRDAAAVAVAAGSVDVLVPTMAPMPVVGDDGLTLHVLVDDEPFAGHDVMRALAGAAVDKLPIGAMDRLPIDVAVQARLRVYRGTSP